MSTEKRKRVREDSEKGLEVPREADPEEKRRGSGGAFVQFVFEKIFERDQSDGVLLAESDRRDPEKYDQGREEKLALMPRRVRANGGPGFRLLDCCGQFFFLAPHSGRLPGTPR